MKKIVFLFIFPALVIVGVYSYLITADKNQSKKASIQTLTTFQEIKAALKAFKKDCGFYPETRQGLMALTRVPVSKPLCDNYPEKPYLDPSKILDPWGKQIRYVFTWEGQYKLISYGKDKKLGGSGINTDIYQLVNGKKGKK